MEVNGAGASTPTKRQAGEEQSLATLTPAQKRRRKSIESIVLKCRHDAFSKLTTEEFYVKKDPKTVMTLNERLIHDKTVSTAKRPLQYYQNLTDIYGKTSTQRQSLCPSNADQEFSRILWQAMLAAKGNVPDRTLMHSYFTTCIETPNEIEVCGCLNFLRGLRIADDKQKLVFMDGMRWVAQFLVNQTFQKQWNAVAALCENNISDIYNKQLRRGKHGALDHKAFCMLHQKIVEIFIDAKDLQTLLQCGDLALEYAILMTVVRKSEVGRTIFGFALKGLLATTVAKTIDGVIAEMSGRALTTQSLKWAKHRALIAVESLDNINQLAKVRHITARPSGDGAETLQTCVHGLAQEVSFRFGVWWKAAAVKAGVLEKFKLEGFVDFGEGPPWLAGSIHEDVTRSANAARALAWSCIENVGPPSLHSVSQALQRYSAEWLLADPEFAVEIAIMEKLVNGGESAALRLIIDIMPSRTRVVSPEHAFGALQTLVHSDRHNYFSPAVQAKIAIVMQHLSRIVDRREVDVKTALEDSFLRKVLETYPYFIRAGQLPQEQKFGFSALQVMMRDLCPKLEDGSATLEDVGPFVIWSYLVPEPEKSRWQEKVRNVRDHQLASASRRAGKKAVRRGKNTDEVSGAADVATSVAMSMFTGV